MSGTRGAITTAAYRTTMDCRSARWLMAIGFGLLAAYYSLTTPIFEAPDELWHYLVAADLAHGHFADPSGPAKQEATQPPLYYGAAALLWRLVPAPPPDTVLVLNPQFGYLPTGSGNKNVVYHDAANEAFPYVGIARTVHLVRLLSVVLGAAVVLGVFRLGRAVAPERPNVALLAAGFCGLNPELLFLSGAINNDLAVVAGCTWTLAFLSEWVGAPEARPARVAPLGVALALALASKATALGLVPIVGGALIVFAPAGEAAWRRIGRAALAVGVPLAVAGWWYVRLWLLYHDPLGTAARNVALGRTTPFTVGEAVGDLGEMAVTFFARFGWSNVAPPPWLPLAFVVVAVGGLIVGLTRPAVRRAPVFLVQIAWIGLLLVLFYLWQIQIPGPQGRLLFPAIGSLAVIWAAGAAAALDCLGRPIRRGLMLGMASLGLAVAILIPSAVVALAYTAQPIRLLPSPPMTARSVVASFGDEVDLVGYAPSASDWHPGDTIPLRLYWRRGANPAHELSFDVHLVDYRGLLVVGADAPLAPTLPLALWPRDRVVEIAAPLHLPAEAAVPQLLRFDVGVYTLVNGEIHHLATERGSESIAFEPIRIVGATRATPRPAVVRFGPPAGGSDVLDLVDWSVDQAGAHPGGMLRGRLIWSAETAPRIDYTVFVHLVRDGKLIAQYDAPPRDGAYPTTAWRPDEVVPDAFSLRLPGDLGPGSATLEIGLYDLKTLRRLPFAGGDAWRLTTIEIRSSG